MLVAAAVVPHPPLLVPGMAAGADQELGALRRAAVAAVRRVVGAGVDRLTVLGAGDADGADRAYDDAAWGGLAGYGRPDVLPAGRGPATLPLSLTVGHWLVEHAAPGLRPHRLAVSSGATAAHCARLGRDLADEAHRVGLVVAGDASARRSLKGPGYLDERAEPFDDAVAAALAAGDAAALLGLDADLADDLLVAGRAPWQVLAGAAAGRPVSGEVTYADAPYGVTYLVATWTVG